MVLTLKDMIASARAEVSEIAPADARQALDSSEIALVVDVREPGEYQESHVPHAVNIPRGLLEIRADPNSPVHHETLVANQPERILVYCTKGPGARSLLAAQTLASMGYDRVEVLGGGLVAWTETGLPVESEHQPAQA